MTPEELELEDKIRALFRRMKLGEMTYPDFDAAGSALLAEATAAGMSIQAEADAVYRATDGQEPYITTTRDGVKTKVYGRPAQTPAPRPTLPSSGPRLGPDGRDGEVNYIQGVRVVRGAKPPYPQGFTPSPGSGGIHP